MLSELIKVLNEWYKEKGDMEVFVDSPTSPSMLSNVMGVAVYRDADIDKDYLWIKSGESDEGREE